MISGRLLVPVLALVARASSQCADGVNEGVNNCQVDPRLISINCQSDSPCNCTDSMGLCADYGFGSGELPNLIEYDTANGDKCEELCQAIWDDGTLAKEKKCQYYKFEERPKYVPDEGRNCYFMSSEQCEEEAVVPCEEPFCRSGQVDCGDPPPTPEPDATTCPVNMPELVPGNIHWSCIHGVDQVDPYGDQPRGLPLGTVCTSRHPCYLYPDAEDQGEEPRNYHLQFVCQESSGSTSGPTTTPNPPPTTTDTTPTSTDAAPTSTDTTPTSTDTTPTSTQGPGRGLNWTGGQGRANNDGEWVSQTLPVYSSDPSIVSEDGALTDPTCTARHLLLDRENYGQDGLLLQCTQSQVDTSEPNQPVINAPNTCFLFCNFYSVMKIDTKWKDDYQPGEVLTGEKQWRYVISGTGEEMIFPLANGTDFQTAAEQIKCWG